MKALALSLLFLLIAVNEAKVFTKCELATVLKRAGMDGYYGYKLGNWICMSYHESRYNSLAVGPPNSDGSRDYGIFQINSRWWCNNYQGRTANGCNKPCNAFTNDDITDDIVCAKRIVRDPNRMNAWVAWRNHCKGRDLSEWTRGCRLFTMVKTNEAAAMKALALSLLFLLTAANEAKVFTRCELATVLKRAGMDGYLDYKLGNWICMSYHESRYNSRAVGPPNSDGSRDYGIFQINSSWWCNNYQGHTANGCDKPCSAFINDDITDDIVCAKRIVRDPQRMDAWVAWRNYCKGRDLSKWTRGCRL
ncbi:uncharacterized protein LOC131190612 [Ahaetulla prasina]|uniref:uncharacterized protein LOC131190612 n=1 Tax=Ahaetulla prasina TaxID=499056 RepID=UPI002649388F|nr:uncharacterized protein LOC131190612 [Ahaetulla prasina]